MNPTPPPDKTPRPTPETDGKVLLWNLSARELEESYTKQLLGVDGRDINGRLVPTDFARRLERERDEARADHSATEYTLKAVVERKEQMHVDLADLRARLAASESECLEQARLNGMGGQREAKLLSEVAGLRTRLATAEHQLAEQGATQTEADLRARLETAEDQAKTANKSIVHLNGLYQSAEKECDGLRQSELVLAGQNEGFRAQLTALTDAAKQDGGRLDALLSGANRTGGVRAQRYDAYYRHAHHWVDLRTRDDLDSFLLAASPQRTEEGRT